MPFPLTDIQEAYWVGRSANFELGNVSAHGYVEMNATSLDMSRLSQAFQQVIARHDMLRAIIRPDGQQIILPPGALYKIVVTDISSKPAEVGQAYLESVRARMSHQVLPTDRWPVFEICATRLDSQTLRLHASFDAIIADGYSTQIMLQDWYRYYLNPQAGLAPIHYSFRDYVLAEVAQHETAEYARARDYWLKRLLSFSPSPELPLVRAPGEIEHPQYKRQFASIDREHWAALKVRAAEIGLTPSGILAAAFSDILALWSKCQAFSLILTLFNRIPFHPEVNQVVGDFTSTLLLEVNSKQATFIERARALQSELWDALDHRMFSGVRVLRELNHQRGDGHQALMPVVFTSALTNQSAISDSEALTFLGDVVYSVSQTPQVMLDHQVSERQGELVIIWDAIDALFPAGMLEEMFSCYVELLGSLASDPASWEVEGRDRLLIPAGFSRLSEISPDCDRLPDSLLHAPFLAQVAQHPQALAVITSDRSMTYLDLNHRASEISGWLQAHGAVPNHLVAIVMHKGWEQVVAAMAILQAGAAYLPIDASLPPDRIQSILRQGEVHLVLTQTSVDDDLTWPVEYVRFYVDHPEPFLNLAAPVLASPTDLAYVIFTSGSTGQPKGVMIDHRSALNTIYDINDRFRVSSQDRVLALSSLSFDLSVYDIFGLLAAGGTLVIPDHKQYHDPAHWADLVERYDVTLWNSVPALMKVFAEYLARRPKPDHSKLRLAMLSGDWIPVNLTSQIHAWNPDIKVVSLGGATEASIWSILFPIDAVDPKWSSIPYGRAMRNQSVLVLNETLDRCPTWVTGQITIGGCGLAQGYWKDPFKTEASFFNHPITGERLYRTGDLGRYLPDGNIEFLGREDFQVKIQGFRIELGEIETILELHPNVQTCAVTAIGHPQEEKRLVAYLTCHDSEGLDLQEIKSFLGSHLPNYMVPSLFVVLDYLPLTSNGKVDRRALPEPQRVDKFASTSVEVSASAELVDIVAHLVGEILKQNTIPVNVDFFSLGANSIDLIRIVNAVEAKFGARPNIGEIFSQPYLSTLIQFCAAIQAQSEEGAPASEEEFEEGEL